MDDKTEEKKKDSSSTDFYNVKAGLFLACSAGIGLLAGFGGAVAAAKKQGIIGTSVIHITTYVCHRPEIF